MREQIERKKKGILIAAGSVQSKINSVCVDYEIVARSIKNKVVGWYGHVEAVHTADIVAVHLMIHWLDQRLERVEEQIAHLTEILDERGR